MGQRRTDSRTKWATLLGVGAAAAFYASSPALAEAGPPAPTPKNRIVINGPMPVGIHPLTTTGTVSGTIFQVDVTGGSNYAVRVYLAGYPALCGNANTWAYENVSFDNYQALVSMLYTAWIGARSVTLISNQDANGYCQLAYVTAY